jgi:hypothetical protein
MANSPACGGAASLAVSIALAGALLAGTAAETASAQGRLEAHYRATLAGLPIGNGAWTIDFTDDRYTMAASGQVSGLASVFAGGSGTAAVRGAINGVRVAPSSYALDIRTRGKADEVRIALSSAAVQSVSVEPPVKPSPTRAPLTEAHKRGVIDPISAGLVPVGSGGPGPDACRRTVPVFDGRQRYDLALSFKRMETVKAERGYEGPAVVCAVAYRPLGGHDTERFATKFLRESKDIEIWYAPVGDTRFLAAYRISLPTAFGPAVLQATRFVTSARAARPANGGARTQ